MDKDLTKMSFCELQEEYCKKFGEPAPTWGVEYGDCNSLEELLVKCIESGKEVEVWEPEDERVIF